MYEYSIRSPGCPGGLTPPSRWWVICYKPLSPECPPAASGRWPSGNYPVPRFLGASCHNPRVNNNPLSDMQNLSELLASGSPPRHHLGMILTDNVMLITLQLRFSKEMRILIVCLDHWLPLGLLTSQYRLNWFHLSLPCLKLMKKIVIKKIVFKGIYKFSEGREGTSTKCRCL